LDSSATKSDNPPNSKRTGKLTVKTSQDSDNSTLGSSRHSRKKSRKDNPMIEEFEHDDCPQCTTPSVPAEDIKDQTFRSCPKCGHEWYEDLYTPAKKKDLYEGWPGSHS
jgi:ribosomal protein L37AE/L43A